MPKRHAHAQDWLSSMQFACFDCRKCFKQRLRFSQWGTRRPPCPQCKSEMWRMGTAFKAPPTRNVKQWRKVELLIQSGFCFYPNQFGYRRSPKTLREAAALLRKQSEGREPSALLKRGRASAK